LKNIEIIFSLKM